MPLCIAMRIFTFFSLYRLLYSRNDVLNEKQTSLLILVSETYQISILCVMYLGYKMRTKQSELLMTIRKAINKHCVESVMEELRNLADQIQTCPIVVSNGLQILDLTLYSSVSLIRHNQRVVLFFIFSDVCIISQLLLYSNSI